MNYIHEILHDLTGGAGFLDVPTRYHKSARSAQKKAMLLPIVISSAGVVQFPWLHAWISNRKACGLPTSGLVQGALLPAPSLVDRVEWMKRPLSPGEVTNILKGFLNCADRNLSSHSLKATALRQRLILRGISVGSWDGTLMQSKPLTPSTVVTCLAGGHYNDPRWGF